MLQYESQVTASLAIGCVLISLLLLSCDRSPPKELLDQYGQVEYAQFASPIHRDLVHDIPGLNLWRITPFKSVADRNFVVGTTDDARGSVIESPAIFLRLYKSTMSADQAAELSIQILNDSGTPGVRHALKPEPHTMLGIAGDMKAWVEPPHFADGDVVYWTNVEHRCYRASTKLTTGALARKEFDCQPASEGGLDAGGSSSSETSH